MPHDGAYYSRRTRLGAKVKPKVGVSVEQEDDDSDKETVDPLVKTEVEDAAVTMPIEGTLSFLMSREEYEYIAFLEARRRGVS